MNPEAPSNTLESLLQRGDVWRGHHARPSIALPACDTGHAELNAQLLQGGWPLNTLIEVHQQPFSHSEWVLLRPRLQQSLKGYIVLLNPPALPFAQALIQAGLDLDRILVVQAPAKSDFLASFFELARAQACDTLLAWQPKQSLSYTELRKCLLASLDGVGLNILFRPANARQQSSPAALRLSVQLTANDWRITIFKQKGQLQTQEPQTLHLPLPMQWRELPAYSQLDGALPAAKAKSARIMPLFPDNTRRGSA